MTKVTVERKAAIKKTVTELEHICSSLGNEGEMHELAEQLGNNHRTHQQSFMRFVAFYLKKQADKGMNASDLRNEAAQQFAVDVKESGLLERGFPYI